MKTLQQKIEKWKANIAKAEAELAKMPNHCTRKWMPGDLVFIEPLGWGYSGTDIEPTLGIVIEKEKSDPLVAFGEMALFFSDSFLTLISDQEFVGEDWL